MIQIEWIEYFSKEDDETTEQEQRFLDLLKEKMEISHIPLSKVRLKELEEQYFDKLEIEDIDEWNKKNGLLD